MQHLQSHSGSSTAAAQWQPAYSTMHACLQAQRRLAGGCLAVLVGRGALIKPWIWQELREGRELQPTAAERVGIYRQLVAHMRAGFGDDALGEWWGITGRRRPATRQAPAAATCVRRGRWQAVACEPCGH